MLDADRYAIILCFDAALYTMLFYAACCLLPRDFSFADAADAACLPLPYAADLLIRQLDFAPLPCRRHYSAAMLLASPLFSAALIAHAAAFFRHAMS